MAINYGNKKIVGVALGSSELFNSSEPSLYINNTQQSGSNMVITFDKDIEKAILSWSFSKEGNGTESQPTTELTSETGSLTKYMETLTTYSTSRGTLSVYLLENIKSGDSIKLYMNGQNGSWRWCIVEI